jgi:hypothetical protein
MASKRYLSEQIISHLREAEVFFGKGQHDWSGVSEDRCYGADLLPRRDYGSLSVDQAKRLKEGEKGNIR